MYSISTNMKKRMLQSGRSKYENSLKTDPPRQCYGPKCIQSARYGSKYCSDQCGLALAELRIIKVLPKKIEEWSLTPSVAEQHNKEELELIRKQQEAVKEVLKQLDKKHEELDSIIERARNLTAPLEKLNENEEFTQTSLYCVTCGHEIHSKTAVKHMEKCFNRYESRATYSSIYKSMVEYGNMFCDFYDPSEKTYCKRLRVLCAQHYKEPKIGDNEVCGCPFLVNQVYSSEEFCMYPKKSCTKHYIWEKLRRAELDMKKVRQLLKMEDLLEKEREIRKSMADRAGVLGLMLHSTYNHEVMDPLVRSNELNINQK